MAATRPSGLSRTRLELSSSERIPQPLQEGVGWPAGNDRGRAVEGSFLQEGTGFGEVVRGEEHHDLEIVDLSREVREISENRGRLPSKGWP